MCDVCHLLLVEVHCSQSLYRSWDQCEALLQDLLTPSLLGWAEQLLEVFPNSLARWAYSRTPVMDLVLGTESRQDLNRAVCSELRTRKQTDPVWIAGCTPTSQTAASLKGDAVRLTGLEGPRPEPVRHAAMLFLR